MRALNDNMPPQGTARATAGNPAPRRNPSRIDSAIATLLSREELRAVVASCVD